MLLVWVPPAEAQAPPAAELLRSAASYISDFISLFSNVVAEERYEQRTVSESQRRDLVSDFLIVRLPATNDWVSFRDVLEADGRPVRDGGERLISLLLDDTSASSVERARAIVQEGARFNIEGIGSLNDPLLVLAFLQREFSPRFLWTVIGAAPDVGPDVWEVQFEEQFQPTLIRAPGDRDLPALGSVWIEALTGRVLQTTLRVQRSEVTTRYELDPQFGIAVPVEMRESHFVGRNIIRAVASYGRFRSFSVDTIQEFDDTASP
jgi:hypothetical protein